MTPLPLSNRTSSQISFSKMFRCTRSPLILEAMFPLTEVQRSIFHPRRTVWSDWTTGSTDTSVCPVHPRSRREVGFFSRTGKAIMRQLPPASTDAFIKTRIENPLVRLRRIRKMKPGLEFCPPLIMDLCVHMSARLKSLLSFILESQNFSV